MARDPPGPTPSCAPLPSDGLGSFRPRSAPLPAGLGVSGHTRVSPSLFGSRLRRSALSVPRPGGSFRRPNSAYLRRAPPLWARTNGLSLGGAAVGRPGPIRGAGGQSGGGAARARARNRLGEVASWKTGEKEPRLCPVGAGGAAGRRLQLQLRCEGFLAGPSSPTSGALRRGRAAQRASVLSVGEAWRRRARWAGPHTAGRVRDAGTRWVRSKHLLKEYGPWDSSMTPGLELITESNPRAEGEDWQLAAAPFSACAPHIEGAPI
nr:translation initiation factor IF-2-like [Chlorocebus sabaeus]